MKHDQLLAQAPRLLGERLRAVPMVKVRETVIEFRKGPVEVDAVVKVATPLGRWTILIEFKNNGQPRAARAAVNQLLRFVSFFPQGYPVFVAPYISPRSAEICVEAGVGYLDFAGNCRLAFSGVYIDNQGNPNPFYSPRKLRSLYYPKASRVLAVLFSFPGKVWRMQELAGEAKVSLGQVANVKQQLLDREWADFSAQGLRLTDPFALLADWAAHYDFERHRVIECYSMDPLEQIEEKIVRQCRRLRIEYALTGFSGAARLAPFARYLRASIYVAQLNAALLSASNLKKVESGGNLLAILPRDEGVFYGTREIGGAQVAAPVLLYLDLMQAGARGPEAAEFLLEQVIKKQWKL